MNKEGLKPIVNDKTEILILGSCPGDKSIQEQQYYANPNNQFWKLMSRIINVDLVSLSYDQKIESLLNNKIGLWDVMHSCERDGSLDSNIVEHKPNDFSKIKIPKLKLILFNGQKAYKHQEIVNLNAKKKLLSSSSGANSIGFENKLTLWKQIFSYYISLSKQKSY